MNNKVTIKNFKFYMMRRILIVHKNSKFELVFNNNGKLEIYYKKYGYWEHATNYIIPAEVKIILMNFFWGLKMTLEMDYSNV